MTSGYEIARRRTTAALRDLVKSEAAAEAQLHIAIVNLLKATAQPGVTWFHVPNGGKRTPREAATFRAMGVLAGVPDLIIMQPGGTVRFIEVKTMNGRVSEQQMEFFDNARRAGFECSIVRDLDDAVKVLSHWGAIRGARVAA